MSGPPPSLCIVPLGDCPDAIPLLAAWFHAEWVEFDGRSQEEIAQQLGQNLHGDLIPITFLALHGQDVVGTVSLDPTDLPSHEHLTPWLASLYVVPEARGQGIAGALIKHVIQFARSHGLSRIHLWTAGSTGRYERLGWHRVEQSIYGGEAIQVMVRELAGTDFSLVEEPPKAPHGCSDAA